MATIVQKFGGSSVNNADRIKIVAKKIIKTKTEGNSVVAVISAMGDSTDELMDLAYSVCDDPNTRELDMLLTAGERISNSLVAMAIDGMGEKVKSFTGSQAGVLTTSSHGNAKIIEITPDRLKNALKENHIVIVAGFQGVSAESKDITTLGRGGSDTSAIALAAALGADQCEIYTDVDGIYTADPRVVKNASLIKKISFQEMTQMAMAGSKILMSKAVMYAEKNNIPIKVKSSFTDAEGTFVGNIKSIKNQNKITGVASDKLLKLIVLDPINKEIVAKISKIFNEYELNFDFLEEFQLKSGEKIQNVLVVNDYDFTLVKKIFDLEFNFTKVNMIEGMGKLSIIGNDINQFENNRTILITELRSLNIEVNSIFSNKYRISVFIDKNLIEKAILKVHEVFGLGSEKIAQVHGGTGR